MIAGCKKNNPEPYTPSNNSIISTNSDSIITKNINIKDSLVKWIDSDPISFKIYDKASFLSYFPDSLYPSNEVPM